MLRLLSGDDRSVNEPQNTLSDPVIASAMRRHAAGNADAVERDRQSLLATVETDNNALWQGAEAYPAMLADVAELGCLHGGLFPESGDGVGAVEIPRPPRDTQVDAGTVRRWASVFTTLKHPVSLAALSALVARRHELPEALALCERMNDLRRTLGPKLEAVNVPVPTTIDRLAELVDELVGVCREDAPIARLAEGRWLIPDAALLALSGITSYEALCGVRDDLGFLAAKERQLLGRLFPGKEVAKRRERLAALPALAARLAGGSVQPLADEYSNAAATVESVMDAETWLAPDYLVHGHARLSPIRLAELATRLHSLEFRDTVALIAAIGDDDFFRMPLARIRDAVAGLRRLRDVQALASRLEALAGIAGIPVTDLPALYAFLKEASAVIAALTPEDLSLLTVLTTTYAPLLAVVGAAADNLQTFAALDSGGKASEVLRYIELHVRLNRYPEARPPSRQTLQDYYLKTHKLLDHELDGRFKHLQHHSGDVARTLIAIKSGKRLTTEQVKPIFESLACVIAEPALISRHFPMTEDLVDYLIIDEASQVSIAESISLMLRARQTIVFGDELQYGAVGAVNVAERYASQYFKDILRDYALDANEAIPETERERLAAEASRNVDEEDVEVGAVGKVGDGTREWLKTFSVRTSTLQFAKALKNYPDSLNIHYRSFPEIISYSNEFFYRPSQIDLVPNRIRTKPIGEVLRFLPVETQGNSGRNVNLDEIEAVRGDLERLHASGYKGTLGVICSFKEQAARMEELLRKELPFYTELERDHQFKVWFVGDVQGEERELIYYSFVQDKKLDNADLVAIYPKVGGTADNIRRLKMQRLNVGFSRAKDTLVFVHSMPLGDYSDTRLGDALKHYWNIRQACHDNYVTDETVFGSPAEKRLYNLILQTPFYQRHRGDCRLVAQFEIGKYIRQEYHRFMPPYRVDFLLTLARNGKEKSLIIEYDGVEYHTRNPDLVTAHNFDREYLEYDVQRQLELESFGYGFLRINKFSLLPSRAGETAVDVLNERLERAFV